MRFLSNVSSPLGNASTHLSSGQLGLDAFQESFSAQATHINTLTAMTAASAAFSLGRTLGGSVLSQVLGGSLLRAGSWVSGFASEVLTFRGTNQLLNPGSESWLNRSGLLSTTTDFLLLKGAGVLCGGSSAVVSQAVQATAMVGGEYAGEFIGVRERSNKVFSERFAHALATGVAMEVGGRLVRGATAGRVDTFQRNLELRSQISHSETNLEIAQEPLGSMAAGTRSLDELIATAGSEIRDAMELVDRAQHSHSTFTAAHISGIIEAARTQKAAAMALIYLAIFRSNLFSEDHLPAMIEAANHPIEEAAGNMGVAIQRLASAHPRFFTGDHVSAILQNSRFPHIVQRILAGLLEQRPEIFTNDHVPGIIERAKGSEEESQFLLQLVRQRINLFGSAHLPGIIEASAIYNSAGEALLELLHKRYRTILTRDAFFELIRIEEARNAERSYLYGFTRGHFDFFDAEVLPAVIEAAKTQKVAATLVWILAGAAPFGSLGEEPIHPGFKTEHMPAMIEAAKNQKYAARALSSLASRNRKLFTSDHLPGMIEAARAQAEAVDVLKYFASYHSDSFRSDQIPAILEVAIAHPGLVNPNPPDSSLQALQRIGLTQGGEVTPYALNPLLVLLRVRPELREAIPLNRLIEGAATPHSVGVLLRDLARNHSDLFTIDHLPAIIEASRGGCEATYEALAHLIAAQKASLTSDHVTSMLEAMKAQPQLGNILANFVNDRPEVFTLNHLPVAIELMGENVEGAVIIDTLATQRGELFSRDHVSSLIATAKRHKAAAYALYRILERRPKLFHHVNLRDVVRIMYHWSFQGAGPMRD